MVCKYCKDEDGNSIYPYYGLAPHKHRRLKGDPKSSHYLGTWFCPRCGGK